MGLRKIISPNHINPVFSIDMSSLSNKKIFSIGLTVNMLAEELMTQNRTLLGDGNYMDKQISISSTSKNANQKLIRLLRPNHI